MKDFDKAVLAEFEKDNTDLINYLFDYTQQIKVPETVLKIDDRPTFTRGNISCISGKAKSRKSFLMSLISGELIKENVKVLLIDTEQSAYHISKTAQRVLSLSDLPTNENSPFLNILALREYDTATRQRVTESAIKVLKPDIVFIDGLRDLMYSINDEKEATEVVNLLMKWTSAENIHICCVLHENKGDGNTRGHIGTEITNKSETVISVTKEGDLAKVEPKVCRNKEFETFYFEVVETEHGVLPIKCNQYKPPIEQDKQITLYQTIFFDRKYKAVSHTDLVGELRKRVPSPRGGLITKDTAIKRISKAVENGYIIKNKIGGYELADKYKNQDLIDEFEVKENANLPF